MHVHEPLPGKQVIPGLFSLKYAENRAAAFSLTQSIPEGARRPLLLLVSLCACALIAAWYLKLKQADALLMTSFALIIAGALGNFLDRARLAYVIDFLDFYVANDTVGSWLRSQHGFAGITFRLSDHWPTFNIADSCIVSGAIGVVLRTLKPLPLEKGND
jgi:signal peptidase II